MTDRELLQAYAEGNDERAFDALVEKHLGFVYGVAHRLLGNHHLSEEVSQHVFCALAAESRRWAGIASVQAWLYGTTRHKTMMLLRGESRRRKRENCASEMMPSETNHPSNVSVTDSQAAVDEAMGTLSQNDQTALFLRFYEGRTFRELGQTLGIGEHAAQKRVHRAVDRLKTLLMRRGAVLTPALLGTQLFTTSEAAVPSAGLHAMVTKSAMSGLYHSRSVGLWATVFGGARWAWILGFGATAAIIGLLVLRSTSPRASEIANQEVVPNGMPQRSLLATVNDVGLNSTRTHRIDDIEAIYRLEKQERGHAIERLIAYLERNSFGEAYHKDLFQRWTALDPQRNAAAIAQLCGGSDDLAQVIGPMFEIPLARWINADETVALRWVRGLARKDLAEAFAFQATLRLVAQRDLDRAYALLCSRPFNRGSTCAVLAQAVAERHDVPTMLEWLASLTEEDSRVFASHLPNQAPLRQSAGRAKTEVWLATLPWIYQKDAPLLGEWIAKLPDSPRTGKALEAFVAMWAHDEPNEASGWAMSLEDAGLQARAFHEIADAWAAQAPREALAWADTLPDAGQWPARHAAFLRWLHPLAAEQSLEKAETWLAETWAQDVGALPMFVDLAQMIGGRRTLAWSQTLPVHTNRQAMVREAFYMLGRDAATESVSLLDGLNNPDEQAAAVHHFTLGWIVSGGRPAFQRWKSKLDPDSPRYFQATAAEIDLLAALDPASARDRVATLPKTAKRDRVVVRLIERTMHRSVHEASDALQWTAWIQDSHLRQELRGLVEQTRQELAAKPLGTELPETPRADFRNQSLKVLNERLDILATMPFRRE